MCISSSGISLIIIVVFTILLRKTDKTNMQYLRVFLLIALVVVLLSSSIEARKAKKSESASNSIVDEDDTTSFENSDKMKDYIKNLNKKPTDSESKSPERTKDLEEEEKKLKIAAALIADEHKHSSREHANILHRLGRNLHEQGKFDELVQVAKNIVKIHEDLDGPEHFNTAQALGNLGASSFHLGLKKDVEFAMKRALYIFINKFGSSSKEVRT